MQLYWGTARYPELVPLSGAKVSLFLPVKLVQIHSTANSCMEKLQCKTNVHAVNFLVQLNKI